MGKAETFLLRFEVRSPKIASIDDKLPMVIQVRPASTGGSQMRRIYLFLGNILFTLSDTAQLVRQLFVNFSPVADGKDPENPRFTI